MANFKKGIIKPVAAPPPLHVLPPDDSVDIELQRQTTPLSHLQTEAIRDRGTDQLMGQHLPDNREIQSHHALPSLYSGVHLAGGEGDEKRKHRRRKHHSSAANTNGKYAARQHPKDDPNTRISPVAPPSEQVQFLLGEAVDDSPGHERECPPVFAEMVSLKQMPATGDVEWRETARWVKFEEDVEEGGNRWSKPFVATLSLHSLLELRCCLQSGCMLLDMDAPTLSALVSLIIDDWVNKGSLTEYQREQTSDVLLKRHRHQHERNSNQRSYPSSANFRNGGVDGSTGTTGTGGLRTLTDIGRNLSHSLFHHSSTQHEATPEPAQQRSPPTLGHNKGAPPLSSQASLLANRGSEQNMKALQSRTDTQATIGTITSNPSDPSLMPTSAISSTTNVAFAAKHKANLAFMRKIAPGSEAANIMIGEVDFLTRPIYAFVRLAQSHVLGDLTEVDVASRFLFVLLGPKGGQQRYHEIGRAMGTIMSDEVFHLVAYKAKQRKDLLAGIDEFLDSVTVLPPGEWDPNIRIEPPDKVPSQEGRKSQKSKAVEEVCAHGNDPWLQRTGKLFGGLRADIKRKAPFYWADIHDAFALQSLATVFFIYFATLTPVVAFGGLLGVATNNQMAAFESILAAAVVGLLWALFSGQPLTIMGSTGPVLVFETIMFNFCRSNQWDFLAFRFWYGNWIALILFIMVATDLSSLVKYITRFTEESFAALISAIFVYEAFANILKIGKKYKVLTRVDENEQKLYNCDCVMVSQDNAHLLHSNKTLTAEDVGYEPYGPIGRNLSKSQCVKMPVDDVGVGSNAGMVGWLRGQDCSYTPDVFFLSVVLFFGTYVVARQLKAFKTARYFPTSVRTLVSDFAVTIAILIWTLIDYHLGIHTPKLSVPAEFKPTARASWVIGPFMGNPWYTMIVAILPALLGVILIFMDQQITAVIVNRKEHKLKKGAGYHLDLLVLSVTIALCSVLGLPYMVAATVLSITHVQSLRLESETAAPGERPQFLGVREQRVTTFFVYLLIALSVFMTGLLRHIPMPVLYGVFLYMGISALRGVQFVDRVKLMFIPIKYQPDAMYLRHVPVRRIHMFTFIQIICLALLWLLKSFKQTSILFPIMVLALVGIRKMLECLFKREELAILDDVMPEHTRREVEDEIIAEEKVEAVREEVRRKSIFQVETEGNIHIPLATGNVMKIPVKNWEELQQKSALDSTPLVKDTDLFKSIASTGDFGTTVDEQDTKRTRHDKKRDKRWKNTDATRELTSHLTPATGGASSVAIRINGPTPVGTPETSVAGIEQPGRQVTFSVQEEDEEDEEEEEDVDDEDVSETTDTRGSKNNSKA